MSETASNADAAVQSSDAGTQWRGLTLLVGAELGIALLDSPERPSWAVPAALTVGTVGLLMTFRGVLFRTRQRGKGIWVALGTTWLLLLMLGLLTRGAWWLVTSVAAR